MKLHNRNAMGYRNMERARVHSRPRGWRRWLRRQANRLFRHHGRRFVATWRELVHEAERAEQDAQCDKDSYDYDRWYVTYEPSRRGSSVPD